MPTVVRWRRASLELGGARGAGAGELGRAQRCWAGPTASAAAWYTETSWVASSDSPPPTSSSQHNRPPLVGIFAVRVHGVGASPRTRGVASLGVRPDRRFGRQAVLEVHLFDFTGDLYGAHLRVEFLAKLRDEEKYADLDTLKAQITRDCAAARDVLKAFERA